MPQREAFQKYMVHGGAWMGFHFAGFSLTPSAYPQNWDWYHNEFLGVGEYKGNSWRSVSAILRVENHKHRVTRNLPVTFKSAPSEWYSWKNDLRKIAIFKYFSQLILPVFHLVPAQSPMKYGIVAITL